MSATNRGATRKANDFYSTPLHAFRTIIPFLDKTKVHWEPAQGDGRLVREMNANGILAAGDDLQTGYNFLLCNERREVIITNPPFSLAINFFDQALRNADEVFMLQRLNYLGAQDRRVWWATHEPQAILVLSKRPDFTGTGGDACEYGWFYWGKRITGIRHPKTIF